MEGAYLVGRKEILDFINSTLELQISKVEDTASGCVACQLLDIIYPNVVPMSKVNWSATRDFEFVANYRILQTCFTKLQIEHRIDVDKLTGAKYLDTLEFMQWFKRYYELNVESKGAYDCQGQRAKGIGGAAVVSTNDMYGTSSTEVSKPSSSGGSKTMSSPSRNPSISILRVSPSKKPISNDGGEASPIRTTRPTSSGGVRGVTTPVRPQSSTPPLPRASPVKKPTNLKTRKSMSSMTSSATRDEMQQSNQQITDRESAYRETIISELRAENQLLRENREQTLEVMMDLRIELDSLGKERDFYFDKLRDVEIILQKIEDNNEMTELSTTILHILYASLDDPDQDIENETVEYEY